MSFDISDKKLLLIGGNGLLGSEYVRYFCDKVDKMSIIDLESNNINKYINGKNNIYFFKSDITRTKKFMNCISKAINKMNGIDALINNSAITSQFSKNKNFFDEFNVPAWEESISVTLNGTYYACISVIPHMMKKKNGIIINTSSHYGVVAPTHTIYKNEDFNCPLSYTVAKHGIIGLTKWFATKYSKDGIRVNSISPGGVKNKQPKSFIKKYSTINPMGRMANKNEMNGAIHYLISDESKYVIGQNIIIDGGSSVW